MSDNIIMYPMGEKCERCGKCVEVAITSDPNDFSAPCFESECKDDDCPVNSKNPPNSDQRLNIYFVECS
jgi:hypothetical protein